MSMQRAAKGLQPNKSAGRRDVPCLVNTDYLTQYNCLYPRCTSPPRSYPIYGWPHVRRQISGEIYAAAAASLKAGQM